MKKILLTSGCSFTEKNFKSLFHPDMDTNWPMWPEVLAKKLDMECINLGLSGSGNEYIYSTLLDEIVKRDNIGLVIAGWTQSQRSDWCKSEVWLNKPMHYNKSKKGEVVDNDIYACLNKSLRYYYSLQEVCKSKKIPFKQFQMLHLFRGYTYDSKTGIHDLKVEDRIELLEYIMNSSYFDKIDDNFLGWPTDPNLGGYNFQQKVLSENTQVSKEDAHPNAKGQEMIAEFVYERL